MHDATKKEQVLQRALIRLIGAPYKFGGRGPAGIDCSSLIVKGIRYALRLTVKSFPWMTADQLAKGHRGVTEHTNDRESNTRCLLVFFDWDQDAIYEHAAVRLVDGSWIWSSTSAGQVLHVHPSAEIKWQRQWTEIAGSLDATRSTWRTVNWHLS